MAESTEEGKEDTISQEEFDALLEEERSAEEEEDDLEVFFKDAAEDDAEVPVADDKLDRLVKEANANMAETAAIFAEVDELRAKVAELESALAAAHRQEDQLRQSGNALQEKLENAKADFNSLHKEANEKLAEARSIVTERDETVTAVKKANEELTARKKELECELAGETARFDEEVVALDKELDRERTRFHWKEAIASALCTAMIIGIVFVAFQVVDIVTTSDEDSPAPAAIEETRREPSTTKTPSTTTKPAAKPIKKRFGSGSTK